MSQDKTQSLTRYLNDMKSRLNSPVPAKRVGGEEAYYAWIRKEIDYTTKKLESLKLDNKGK